MFIMPRPYPAEFRRDAVAVARKHEAPLNQVAKKFGISESCLVNRLKKADVEDGVKPGVTSTNPSSSVRRRNGSGSWSKKPRSCAAPSRIFPGTSTQNDVPAGP